MNDIIRNVNISKVIDKATFVIVNDALKNEKTPTSVLIFLDFFSLINANAYLIVYVCFLDNICQVSKVIKENDLKIKIKTVAKEDLINPRIRLNYLLSKNYCHIINDFPVEFYTSNGLFNPFKPTLRTIIKEEEKLKRKIYATPYTDSDTLKTLALGIYFYSLLFDSIQYNLRRPCEIVIFEYCEAERKEAVENVGTKEEKDNYLLKIYNALKLQTKVKITEQKEDLRMYPDNERTIL